MVSKRNLLLFNPLPESAILPALGHRILSLSNFRYFYSAYRFLLLAVCSLNNTSHKLPLYLYVLLDLMLSVFGQMI